MPLVNILITAVMDMYCRGRDPQVGLKAGQEGFQGL